jgi:hypothetical protein
MQDIGHEVIIVVSEPVKYDWHKIRVKVMSKGIPDCDAIIASGIHSVDSTVKADVPRKAYYIRGYETWRVDEGSLLGSFRRLPCVVNSPWLQKHLWKNDIKAELIYPGLDLESFTDIKDTRHDYVGAIYHKKHKTKRHADAMQAAAEAGYKLRLLNKHIKGPNEKDLNAWYNTLKVWFSPTESEGLHNPPMEAGLAGCALVCSDHPRSGIPYARNMETALIYPHRNIVDATQCIKRLMESEDLRNRLTGQLSYVLRSEIGGREKNMRKFVEYLNA